MVVVFGLWCYGVIMAEEVERRVAILPERLRRRSYLVSAGGGWGFMRTKRLFVLEFPNLRMKCKKLRSEWGNERYFIAYMEPTQFQTPKLLPRHLAASILFTFSSIITFFSPFTSQPYDNFQFSSSLLFSSETPSIHPGSLFQSNANLNPINVKSFGALEDSKVMNHLLSKAMLLSRLALLSCPHPFKDFPSSFGNPYSPSLLTTSLREPSGAHRATSQTMWFLYECV